MQYVSAANVVVTAVVVVVKSVVAVVPVLVDTAVDAVVAVLAYNYALCIKISLWSIFS